MIITNENIEILAAKCYTNQNCLDKEEFLEDFSRLKYIKRLVKRYKKTGELKERLILNHMVIMFNVFENRSCVQMLFFKMYDCLDVIKPFLLLMNRLPDEVEVNKYTYYTSDITMDQNVVNTLRNNVLCQKQ
jgi:hypothetical protein